MLNDISVIKDQWPGDVLNFDDTTYDSFLQREGKKIERRLKKWVGETAYSDAASTEPADTIRSESIASAEIELFHIAVMEKLWRDKSAGAERDIQLPSGTRVVLQTFSSEEYERIIQEHLYNAELELSDYVK